MYSGNDRLSGVRFPANGAIPIGWIPVLPFDEFRDTLVKLLQVGVGEGGNGTSAGGTLNGRAWASALFAQPLPVASRKNPDVLYRLVVIMGGDAPQWEGCHRVMATTIGRSYPSLTPRCPQLHIFERVIAEKWQIVPVGHPWLKPVRFVQRRFRPLGVDDSMGVDVSVGVCMDTGVDASVGEAVSWGASVGEEVSAGAGGGGGSPGELANDWPLDLVPDSAHNIGITDFYSVDGEEVHEVAVGPVHAGVIEPGHFRFQCHGEEVLHLEISLGYQHRGIEHMLRGGPDVRSLPCVEVVAGDTTIGHTTVFCRIVEALTGTGSQVQSSSQKIRALALELERIANHIGDLGAIAGDIGYLPTSSFCGRIRGDVLNLTAAICGNRFGRGLVRPGGTGYHIDGILAAKLKAALQKIFIDARDAISALWDTPSVLARIETTGTVDVRTCLELGLVGVAARACGVTRDVRADHPAGEFRARPMPVAHCETGDVFGRANVRWQEITNSVGYAVELLDQLEKEAGTGMGEGFGAHASAGTGAGPRLAGAHTGANDWIGLPMAADTLAFAVEEGWRGEICHVALTDSEGKLNRYEVIDPSIHNWMGLAMALRGQQISDFPLCNKSFNLSYCGHDL